MRTITHATIFIMDCGIIDIAINNDPTCTKNWKCLTKSAQLKLVAELVAMYEKHGAKVVVIG